MITISKKNSYLLILGYKMGLLFPRWISLLNLLDMYNTKINHWKLPLLKSKNVIINLKNPMHLNSILSIKALYKSPILINKSTPSKPKSEILNKTSNILIKLSILINKMIPMILLLIQSLMLK